MPPKGLKDDNNDVIAGDGWFPSQRASNAENVSIWWRHHVLLPLTYQVIAEDVLQRTRNSTYFVNSVQWDSSMGNESHTLFPRNVITYPIHNFTGD